MIQIIVPLIYTVLITVAAMLFIYGLFDHKISQIAANYLLAFIIASQIPIAYFTVGLAHNFSWYLISGILVIFNLLYAIINTLIYRRNKRNERTC